MKRNKDRTISAYTILKYNIIICASCLAGFIYLPRDTLG